MRQPGGGSSDDRWRTRLQKRRGVYCTEGGEKKKKIENPHRHGPFNRAESNKILIANRHAIHLDVIVITNKNNNRTAVYLRHILCVYVYDDDVGVLNPRLIMRGSTFSKRLQPIPPRTIR